MKMSDFTAFKFDDDEGGSLSDDEFFDSVEVEDASTSVRSPASLSPAGVRRALPGMTGLISQQPLMEPLTQAAVPLTEDVAKQQQELLSRLGVGPESTILRQQLQSAALVSDMQAFKAANPGACLADFIRWYSPKDWIPVDPLTASSFAKSLPPDGRDVWWFEGQGMLSDRMRSASGGTHASSTTLHLWHQMWESSVPTPVSKSNACQQTAPAVRPRGRVRKALSLP
jgi:Rab3 GTPase-activating protein catalytic subunit